MVSLDRVVSTHAAYLPDIAVNEDGTACGTWAMTDDLRFPEGGPFSRLVGWGHYHERYALEGGIWRITALRIQRIRIDTYRR